jgi:hypothetical protein
MQHWLFFLLIKKINYKTYTYYSLGHILKNLNAAIFKKKKINCDKFLQ